MAGPIIHNNNQNNSSTHCHPSSSKSRRKNNNAANANNDNSKRHHHNKRPLVIRIVSNTVLLLLFSICLLNVFWLGGHISDLTDSVNLHPENILQQQQRRASETVPATPGDELLQQQQHQQDELQHHQQHNQNNNMKKKNKHDGVEVLFHPVVPPHIKHLKVITDDKFKPYKDHSSPSVSVDWDDRFLPTKEEEDLWYQNHPDEEDKRHHHHHDSHHKNDNDDESRDSNDKEEEDLSIDESSEEEAEAGSDSEEDGEEESSSEEEEGTEEEEESSSDDDENNNDDTDDYNDQEKAEGGEEALVEEKEYEEEAEKVEIKEDDSEDISSDEEKAGSSDEENNVEEEEGVSVSADEDNEEGSNDHSLDIGLVDNERDGEGEANHKKNRNSFSNNNNNKEILSTNRVLSLLQSAGADLSVRDERNNLTLQEQLPSWELVESLYYDRKGPQQQSTTSSNNKNYNSSSYSSTASSSTQPQPIVYGLDTCQKYRDAVSLDDAFLGVAGLFNTGTNAMYWLLDNNINEDILPTRWQVPWGKHRLEKVRMVHDAPDTDWGMYNRANILPIVVIKDPFTWMQSMCKSSYEAHWKHRAEHCPNLQRYTKWEKNHIPHDPVPVKIVFEENSTEPYSTAYWESLLHLYNDWYMQYYNATYPRLIVRFEDLLFLPDRLLNIIANCVIGGSSSDSGDPHQENNNNNNNPKKRKRLLRRLLRKRIRLQVGASKSHGQSSDLVHAMIKYGTGRGRLQNMTRGDLMYANKILSSEPLFNFFNYQKPIIPADEEERGGNLVGTS